MSSVPQEELQTRQGERVDEELTSPQSKILDAEALYNEVAPDQVTVVIPTLNESGAIGLVIDELRKEGFDNILVVDGYSMDGTAEMAKDRGARVVRQLGSGKAGALDTAVRLVQTPFTLVIDGDGTYPAADARRLLTFAKDYDEVIGARVTGRHNIPIFNRLGNWLITKTFKLLHGTPITDVLSGMYLLKTDMLRGMNITSTSFDVEVEIASNVASSGRITQVPIGYRDRVGKQKLRRTDGIRILSTLFWMAYYNNPLLLFGGLISLCAIPGAAILAYTLYTDMTSGIWHGGYALLGAVLLLLATQAAALSLGSLLTKRSENRILQEIRRASH